MTWNAAKSAAASSPGSSPPHQISTHGSPRPVPVPSPVGATGWSPSPGAVPLTLSSVEEPAPAKAGGRAWGGPRIFNLSHNSTDNSPPSLSFRTAVRNLGKGGAGLPTHPTPSPSPPPIGNPSPRAAKPNHRRGDRRVALLRGKADTSSVPHITPSPADAPHCHPNGSEESGEGRCRSPNPPDPLTIPAPNRESISPGRRSRIPP